MRVFLLLLFSATAMAQSTYLPKFDVQGHRGARGLMPENSIEAFLLAIDTGVTTIEMDLAITKDKQVIISHEGWMSASICLDPEGNPILPKKEKTHNIYQMTYEEVMAYDCGSKPYDRFPNQKKMKVSKPRLVDAILAIENYIKGNGLYEIDYNLEIKSDPSSDNKFHPRPEEFSDLVYNLINQYLPMERVVVQSFDFRVLKYWHTKYPHVRLAALVSNLKSIDENIKALGFTPSVYSPEYTLLSKGEIKRCHDLKMRVIPWTVNDKKEMEELKLWGVDGIITDYPDSAKALGYTVKRTPPK